MDACRRRKLRRVSAKTEAAMSDETKEARKKITLENKARSLPRCECCALGAPGVPVCLTACAMDSRFGLTYLGRRRG